MEILVGDISRGNIELRRSYIGAAIDLPDEGLLALRGKGDDCRTRGRVVRRKR